MQELDGPNLMIVLGQLKQPILELVIVLFGVPTLHMTYPKSDVLFQ